MKTLVQKFFKSAKILPIDFDQSANRYLDSVMLRRIEQEGMKYDLLALKSEENLKKHRAVFKEKIAFLREAGPDVHVAAVRAWWEKKLKELDDSK